MFGFKEVDRVIYKNNFLRKIFFQVSFSPCKNLKNNSDKIKELFNDTFPRFSIGKGQEFQFFIQKDKTDFKNIDQGDAIKMKSADGQKQIEILEQALIFSIDGSAYESYESISNDLNNIIKLFEICNIGHVNKISSRKLNIVDFNYTDESIPIGILEVLLNKALVSSYDAFNGMEFINHNLHSINFVNEEYALNLKYGMNVVPIKDKSIGQLVIDIEASATKEILIAQVKVENKKLNSEIFNAFSWIINDYAKKMIANG